MTQARRSEFDLSHKAWPAAGDPARVTEATGHEAPVTSPALELQRALDEMFTAAPVRRTDYVRGVTITALTVATAAACLAFWWTTLHWATSLLA